MGPDAGQRPVQEPQEQSGNAALGPSFLLNQQLGLDARGQDRSEGPPSTWNPEEGFSHTHLPASTPGRHLGREARPSLRELDPFLPQEQLNLQLRTPAGLGEGQQEDQLPPGSLEERRARSTRCFSSRFFHYMAERARPALPQSPQQCLP